MEWKANIDGGDSPLLLSGCAEDHWTTTREWRSGQVKTDEVNWRVQVGEVRIQKQSKSIAKGKQLLE